MLQLTEKDSFPFVEDCTDRHVRLCAQTIGGEKYAAKIKVPYDNLNSKLVNRKAASKNVSAAGDVIWLHNEELNNVIRKVQGRAKEYDKQHLGANTTIFLLPDGNITPIIELKVEEKPVKVNAISLKLVSLGNTHTLFPLAAEVDLAVNNLTDKLKLREDAKTLYSAANTEAYVAKVALVNQYNANYFDAAHDVNKEYAEKLFPHITRHPDDDDDNTGNPSGGTTGGK